MWGFCRKFVEGLVPRNAVQVDDADRLAPLLLAADVHLGDIHSLVAQRLAR